MKRIKNPIIRIVLIALMIGAFAHVKGLPNLVSVRKGIQGEKSWVVFSFDDSVKWAGIQQVSDGNLILYFQGSAGSNDGMNMILDSETGINVNINQSKQKKSLFMASINCEMPIPLAVLKRENTLVIGFNDDRLVNNPYPKNPVILDMPHTLNNVAQDKGSDKTVTNLNFDRAVDIGGFFYSPKDAVQLLFKNTTNWSGQNEYLYTSGNLQSISFNSIESEVPYLWVNLNIVPNSPFSIFKEKAGLAIRMTNKKNGDDLVSSIVPDEKSAFTMDSNFANTDLFGKPVSFTSEGTVKKAAESAATDQISSYPDDTYSGEGEGIPWDQIVSFEFSATPIVDALRLVAVSNNLNMVIGEGVEGVVTMNLQNVTLKDALQKILYTHNYEYVIEKNIITIKPAKIEYIGGRITKVYRLHYADADNVADVIKTIASGDSLVQVFRPEFLNFKESGKNRMDAAKVGVQGIHRASMLVVNDRPEKIREIDRVISELDRPPVQFFIESKLVEMSPNASEQLGVDWEDSFGLMWDKTMSALDGEALGSGYTKNLLIQNVGDQNTGPLSVDKTWRLGHLNAAQYIAMIDFIKKQTDSKLISNPRILAMDNEESSISVGTTVPIPVLQRGSAGKEDMISFEYKEINVQLNVSPHLGKNEEVIMYVNPVIEEIIEWVEYGIQRAPVTAKRSVNSIITVKNGETVVIGGLIKNQKTLITKRVWLLGSIPLIGPLFQHKTYTDIQTDLMIFITPSIVQE